MINLVVFFIRRGLLLFLFINFTYVFTQNVSRIDSLSKVLIKTNLSKKEKINILLSLANLHTDANNALLYAKQSLKLSIEIDNPILQAESLEEISLKERKLGNNDLSLKASLEALRIYESLSMTKRQAASYAQLANNYLSNENYTLAIKYLKRAKLIYSNSDKNQNYVITILNLGEAYRLTGNLDSAETNFNQSLKLNKLIKNVYIESYTLGNLGMVYNTQNKSVLAKKNLNNAIKILKPLEDYYSTSVYIAELGKVYQKEGKHKIAENKFLEALDMAKQARLKEQIRDFSALLTNFYEEQNLYNQAFEYQKLFQVYQDSLVNKKKVQKIEQLKAGYEIDKRESEIGLLNTINNNQKHWVIALLIGVSLLLLFAYLLYRGNKKVKTTNIILSKREQEKALLLRELNHRIKNNLQMISSLLNLQSHELTGHPAKEAIVAGKHRVEALSLVHRKLYQEDLDTRIHLKDYVEELVLGLFHGYDAAFNPSFKIDNISVNLDVAVPLALVMNELIINALKYAYHNIEKPKLNIIMTQDEDYLMIQIIDNGIGFNTEKAIQNNSFGIKLIHSLTEQLEGSIKKLKSKTGTHWKMNVKIA